MQAAHVDVKKIPQMLVKSIAINNTQIVHVTDFVVKNNTTKNMETVFVDYY